MVFKTDFEMTYDHVDWSFLEHALERKGFNLKWRSWMSGCLFSSSRGLRRGNSLSPFLFTLVTYVLSRLMIKAKESAINGGLIVGKDRTRVSLLQFADDTIFFSKVCLEHL